jgi:predicted SAM-dependent methyltransferase
MEHMDELGVVGGVYVAKTDTCEPLVFRGNGAGPYWKWRLGEYFEVTGLGMDATMIRTDVFRQLKPPWFVTIDKDDYLDGIPNAEQWTEDLWLCNRVANETDYKLYIDGSIICNHWDAVTRKKWTLRHDSYPMQMVENPRKMVDLGCGLLTWEFENEGTPVRVDIREEVEPDYRCDLRQLPFDNESFEVVFSSHTLEHFGRNEIDDILDEWLRILEPGGEFRLAIPNIQWAAEKIIRDDIDGDVLNVLYGSQTYPENFHKFGFTPKMIKDSLERRGMTIVDEQHEKYNLMIRAIKGEPKKKKRKSKPKPKGLVGKKTKSAKE